MGTSHRELFAALAAPFPPAEVRSRTQAGRTFPYLTARQVMNRLDDVLGPENWWDEFLSGENGVICKLTLRLPDGSTLTKCDAGGHAGMADSGDDEKSGFSDALKRAAVKFGIGRELYGNGVAEFAPQAPTRPAVPVRSAMPPAAPQRAAPPPLKLTPTAAPPAPQAAPRGIVGENGQPVALGWPTHGGSLFAWSKKLETAFNVAVVKYIDGFAQSAGYPRSYKEFTPDQVQACAAHAAKMIATLPGYDGQFDARIPDPDTLRQTLAEKLKQRLTQMGMTSLTYEQLCELGGQYAASLPSPFQLADLDECRDEASLRALIAAVDNDLDDVPF